MNEAHLLTRRLHSATPDPAAIVAAVPAEQDVVWLDSGAERHDDPVMQRRARWSVIAVADGPFGATAVHVDRAPVLTMRRAAEAWFGNVVRPSSGIFETLAAAVAAAPRIVRHRLGAASGGVPECPFALGWVGYLGYECGRECDGPDRSAPTPDMSLRFVDRAIVVDHVRHAVWGLALGADMDREATAANARWLASLSTSAAGILELPSIDGLPKPDAVSRAAQSAPGSVRRVDYRRAVQACRSEIRSGNAFQVCLTTSFTLPSSVSETTASVTETTAPVTETTAPVSNTTVADPTLADYLRMRTGAPVPFGAYVRLGAVRLASRSPERFIRVDPDGTITAEPIKGTAPRSEDPVGDAAVRGALATSAKDCAENVMIVDLLRNDVQRSSVPGSVRVERLCAVETYSTVHQLVSTVVGVRRPEVSPVEVVRNAFPPGSMTGAPKPSAMAVIERLEGKPRGVYAGAFGYFSLCGRVDLAVAIRTLVVVVDAQGAVCSRSLGSGGAVTWSSDPEAEADEVVCKTRSVLGPLGFDVAW